MKKIKNNFFVIILIYSLISCKENETLQEAKNHHDPLLQEINLSLNVKASLQNNSVLKNETRKEIDTVIKYHYSGEILNFAFSINPESPHDLQRVDNQIFKHGIFGSSFLVRSLKDHENKAEDFSKLLATDAANISRQLLSKLKNNSLLNDKINLPVVNNSQIKLQSNNSNKISQQNNRDQINEDFNFANLDILYRNGDYKNFLNQYKKIKILINLSENKSNQILQDTFIKFQNNYFIEGFLKVLNKPIPVVKATDNESDIQYFSHLYNKLVTENEDTFTEFICLAFIVNLYNNGFISKIYNSRSNQLQYSILDDRSIKENMKIFFKEGKLDEELLFNTFLKNTYNFNKNFVPEYQQQVFKNKLVTLVERLNI